MPTCPVCISCTETRLPRTGLTSRLKCPSNSPIYTLCFTSSTSPCTPLLLHQFSSQSRRVHFPDFPRARLLTGTGCGTPLSAWFVVPSARSIRSSNSTKSSSWSSSGKLIPRKSCCSVYRPARFASLSVTSPATCFSTLSHYVAVAMLNAAFSPHQVDSALERLSEKYDGPLPSDLCDLLEGEEFFAGFEMGLALTTGLASFSGPPQQSCVCEKRAPLVPLQTARPVCRGECVLSSAPA